MGTHLKHAPKEGFVPPPLLVAIRFLITLAFLVGSYLLLVSLRGMNAVGCGPESGCEKVLHSRWAYWFGLPVSLFALVVYATIFMATFKLRPKTPAANQRLAWDLLIPSSIMVIGAGVWFFFLQVAIIKAICPFCMTAHGCGFIASVLLLLSAPYSAAPEKPWQRERQVFVTSQVASKLVACALAGVVVLVAGQILHEKKTFVVTYIPAPSGPVVTPTNLSSGPLAAPSTTTNGARLGQQPGTNLIPFAVQSSNAHAVTSPVAASAVAPSASLLTNTPPPRPLPPNPYAGRFFIVYNTNILDLQQVPVIGRTNAPYMLVSLYDYTCHHCKLMHAPLLEVYRSFSNELGIISLPMPLDPRCNHLVKQTPAVHTNGCDYARLGLAVWRANRAKMAEFDDWMFASEQPPALALARQRAAELVGPDKLERALTDAWIERQLQQDVSIYEVAYNAHRGSMPQLIIGLRVAVGTLGVKDLYRLLAEQFALSP